MVNPMLREFAVTANKEAGVRACLIHETFSAHQSIEDDDLNLIFLGGLVVGHAFAWEPVQTFLAARPSGTEDTYKIYAESFRGTDHLRRILEEAQTIVGDALAASPQEPGNPSDPKTKEKP